MINYLIVMKIFTTTILKMLLIGGAVMVPLLIINYKIEKAVKNEY